MKYEWPYRTNTNSMEEKPTWEEESVETRTVKDNNVKLEIVRVQSSRSCQTKDRYGHETKHDDMIIEYRFSIEQKYFLPSTGYNQGSLKSFSLTKEELKTILRYLKAFPELGEG